MDDDSFPVYKRRDPESGGNSFVNNQGLVVTNQWTITFNKDILLLWGGHANLKIVTSVINVKYIFKYEFKGKLIPLNSYLNKFFYFKDLTVSCSS